MVIDAWAVVPKNKDKVIESGMTAKCHSLRRCDSMVQPIIARDKRYSSVFCGVVRLCSVEV